MFDFKLGHAAPVIPLARKARGQRHSNGEVRVRPRLFFGVFRVLVLTRLGRQRLCDAGLVNGVLVGLAYRARQTG